MSPNTVSDKMFGKLFPLGQWVNPMNDDLRYKKTAYRSEAFYLAYVHIKIELILTEILKN